MPFGLKRYQRTEQPHFLTWSCYRRRQYFASAALKDVFLDCLERIRRRYGFRVFGYVVMPEHVHLLVSEPDVELLSTAIQALKLSVFRHAAVAGWREPPFWQKRYYDHNVRTAESFSNKLRYMHRNPVRRGLCADPIDWHWSSFRHYATAEIGAVEIESEWTAMRRQGRIPHLPTPGRCGAPTAWEGWSE
ncbi:MAG TPA: transposase [Terriglobales bacterium]